MLGIWNTHVANGALYSLQHDVAKDFEPISLISDTPLLIVAKKTQPANDLRSLIAWLKAAGLVKAKGFQPHPVTPTLAVRAAITP